MRLNPLIIVKTTKQRVRNQLICESVSLCGLTADISPSSSGDHHDPIDNSRPITTYYKCNVSASELFQFTLSMVKFKNVLLAILKKQCFQIHI